MCLKYSESMCNMSSFQEYAITLSWMPNSKSQKRAERTEPFISQIERAETA